MADNLPTIKYTVSKETTETHVELRSFQIFMDAWDYCLKLSESVSDESETIILAEWVDNMYNKEWEIRNRELVNVG